MTTEDKPTAILFDHCQSIWNAMDDKATDVKRDPEDENSETDRTYEGHLTRLFQQVGMSAPYYTSVMRALKEMGCVEQTRRGGGNAKSRWLLVNVPTKESFEATTGRRFRGGRINMMEQGIREMSQRLLVVEKALGLRD